MALTYKKPSQWSAATIAAVKLILSFASKQDVPAEGAFVDGDKTKLDGIEEGATADQDLSSYQLQPAEGAFVDGDKTKLDAALTASSPELSQIAGINTQTGTEYTLVLTDAGKLIECNNAAPFNLIIPLNASVAFPAKTVITIEQSGAGIVTIVPTAGVTVNGDLTTLDQYNSISLIKKGTDSWVAYGGSGTIEESDPVFLASEAANFVTGDKDKLDGIEAGATADQDLSGYVQSDITGVTGADQVTNVISLTQTEYDAIVTPDVSTFYIITS